MEKQTELTFMPYLLMLNNPAHDLFHLIIHFLFITFLYFHTSIQFHSLVPLIMNLQIYGYLFHVDGI